MSMRIIVLQLNPTNSNSVISNSSLFRTQNHLPWFCSSVINIDYFELPLFRTIFLFPCELEMARFNSFSSPEPTILLTCGRDRGLWPDTIFWACAEYSFRILSQSDLPDLTGSPWIADFRCWTSPELSIPAAGRKDRGLWGREWVQLYL